MPPPPHQLTHPKSTEQRNQGRVQALPRGNLSVRAPFSGDPCPQVSVASDFFFEPGALVVPVDPPNAEAAGGGGGKRGKGKKRKAGDDGDEGDPVSRIKL